MSPVREPSEEYTLCLWWLAVMANLRYEVREDTLWVWFPIENPRLQVCGFTDTFAVANVPLERAA